mmetsp:Transcript_5797/g.21913  ORF Transcript_5797/g.21913 Transcript_5797/m.21913 type:complete len:230 (-) Transcript_5797:6804-7493(-)
MASKGEEVNADENWLHVQMILSTHRANELAGLRLALTSGVDIGLCLLHGLLCEFGVLIEHFDKCSVHRVSEFGGIVREMCAHQLEQSQVAIHLFCVSIEAGCSETQKEGVKISQLIRWFAGLGERKYLEYFTNEADQCANQFWITLLEILSNILEDNLCFANNKFLAMLQNNLQNLEHRHHHWDICRGVRQHFVDVVVLDFPIIPQFESILQNIQRLLGELFQLIWIGS